MSEPCSGLEDSVVKAPRLLRNGMDYEPKKTYPPDYSNVPSVRDWQMSPFGNERFDLDEIQRAEKKGYKGRFELERLKSLYSGSKEATKPELPPCPVCAEREAAEKRAKKTKCSSEYLYQPYGPAVVSSLSYSKPESNRPRIYTSLGPSHYAGFRFKVPAPDMVSPIPCNDYEVPRQNRVFNHVYIPYGPYGELRMTPDMYTPMGPSILPSK